MLKKIVDFVNNLNHKHFNLALLVACGIAVLAVMAFGQAELLGVLGNIGGITLNLSFFIVTFFGIQYFMAGTDVDIPNEIFVEHNSAAAIYMGLLSLALATIIAKGFIG